MEPGKPSQKALELVEAFEKEMQAYGEAAERQETWLGSLKPKWALWEYIAELEHITNGQETLGCKLIRCTACGLIGLEEPDHDYCAQCAHGMPKELIAMVKEASKTGDMMMERDEALDRAKKAERENTCDFCWGAGKAMDGGPCMCHGTGKMSEAAKYLREKLIQHAKQPPPVCTGSGTVASNLQGVKTLSEIPSRGHCGICGGFVQIDDDLCAVVHPYKVDQP